MFQFESLTNCISLLNEQGAVLEALLEQHSKALALLETALSTDFLQQSKLIIHDFLWTLSDIVKQAKRLNEDLLNKQSKITKILSELTKMSDPFAGSDNVH